MAEMNKGLYPEIETMIVFSSPQYSHISSGFIKEVATHKGSLEGLVPQSIIEALKNKL